MEHKQRVREKKISTILTYKGTFENKIETTTGHGHVQQVRVHVRRISREKKNENKTEERVKLQKENETSPTKLLSPECFFCHK
jgi:hypothetical protein